MFSVFMSGKSYKAYSRKKRLKRRPKKTPKHLLKFKKVDKKTGKLVQKENNFEKKIRLILQSLSIDFHQEHKINFRGYRKSYDFFCYRDSSIENYSFFIECHGSYFHGAEFICEDYPFKKKKQKKTRLQKKNIRNDKIKSIIAKKIGVPLLVIWEWELEISPKMVRKKIKNFFNENLIRID